MTPTLLPHQRYAANFIKDHPFCGLFLAMGLGKTLTTLTALYELNPQHHVLIVGPKSVMSNTWSDEIKKWNIPLKTDSFILDENNRPLSAKKRLAKYDALFTTPPTIYFINYELLCNLIEHLPHKNNLPIWPFQTVILDEAQAFKSSKSKRFRALRSVLPQITRLVELTGTPAPNSLEDLWALIYLLDRGQRLGRTITEYRNKYFNPGMKINGYFVNWKPKPGATKQVTNLISDITISFDSLKDTLPPVTYNDVPVHLDTSERALYKEMVKEKVLTFIDNDGTEHSSVAVNAAVLSAKLCQMASGALYLDNTNTSFSTIHARKLDAALNIICQAGSPVIIAYRFKSDLTMLQQYFANQTRADLKCAALDNTPKMIKDWNDGKIDVLFLQPASSGHGLNLQYGGYTLIWYSLPWSLEHYQQTNARIARQGQANPVIIHHLITTHTIDPKTLAALKNKDTTQKAILNAVSATLDDIDS